MRAARRPPRAQRGFTLLELALVLLVTGILLTLAVPRLPSFGRTDLEASADRLAAVMTWLSDEAALRGRIYRLTLDLDGESWDVAALAPYATPDELAAGVASGTGDAVGFRTLDDDPMVRSTQLPPGVVLDVVRGRDGDVAVGRHEVWFLPEGSSDDLRVRLAEAGGATATVAYRSSRGTATREDTVEDTPERAPGSIGRSAARSATGVPR